MKSDLEKMDANVAQMYASKCQKSPEDLLALMKKGGWLTAKEALEWGFVQQPSNIFARFIDALTNFFSNSNTLSKMEQANTTTQQEQVQTQQPAPQASVQQPAAGEQVQTQQEQPAADAQAQAQQHALEQQRQTLEAQHNTAIAAKDQEIATLRAELDALKKAPGASTSQVVETDKKDNPQDKHSAVEDFFATRQRATELYNLVP